MFLIGTGLQFETHNAQMYFVVSSNCLSHCCASFRTIANYILAYTLVDLAKALPANIRDLETEYQKVCAALLFDQKGQWLYDSLAIRAV